MIISDMLKRFSGGRRCILLLLFLLVSIGCGKRPVVIPEELTDWGLVVARISAEAMPEVLKSNPVINETLYTGGLRDGILMVSLLPGDYTLNSFEIRRKDYHFWADIKRRFTIKRGTVTNLGLLHLETNPAQPGKIRWATLDNSAEMRSYLQAAHPRLYASLAVKEFLSPAGYFLNAAQTKAVRERWLSRVFANQAEWYAGRPDLEYVTGPLGIVSKLTRTVDGRVVSYRLVDTKLTGDMRQCSSARQHVVCAFPGAREYLDIQGTTAVTKAVPPGVLLQGAYALPGSSIALIDFAMNIHVSRDGGSTWKRFSALARKKKLDAAKRTDAGVHAGRNGFYVFSNALEASGSAIVYIDYRSDAVTRFVLPKKLEDVVFVQETDAGLFANTEFAYFRDDRMFFKPAGKSVWQMRKLPCNKQVLFEDLSGMKVQAYCGGPAAWTSDNAGVTWKKTLRENTYFLE